MSIIKTFFLCLLSFALSSSGHKHEGSFMLRFLDQMRLSGDNLFDLSDGFGGNKDVYVGSQDGLKETDRIVALPGQPAGVDFDQFAGYVTVDPKAGRALFYYFVESPVNAFSKPLVLWLNGGPGASSFGIGAMTELGPFRVNKDGRTLSRNEYAWNLEANVIFLESPAGVGFFYSNTTSDYGLSGDKHTAADSYVFLLNWLERYPEYKSRDLYLTGESYAGHYIPQLAQTITQNNAYPNRTKINLRGFAMGNAYVDYEDNERGQSDYKWKHALIPDEIYISITSTCNFSSPNAISNECEGYLAGASKAKGKIDSYNIYAPICNSSYSNASYLFPEFDPCSDDYVFTYLNLPDVQRSLHANTSEIPYPWKSFSNMIGTLWKDRALTVLPLIQELMNQGLRVWMYSGDIDSVVPVTSTQYSIKKLGVTVQTSWYPWYTQGEVGGYTVGYENLTFVTVRGSGHLVPSYQPARSLELFNSFLKGQLPQA